jgi:ferric iron reductase protein FhuF
MAFAPVTGAHPMAAADVVAAVRRAGDGNPLLGIGLDPTAGMPAERLCASGSSASSGSAAAADLALAADSALAADLALAADSALGADFALAADLVARVAARLGGCERRVAASMVVLGYSARLVGPAVSMLLREHLLLDLRPENVRFDYDPRLGFSLNLVRPVAWRGDHTALRAGWTRLVVDGHLRPLIDAVRAVVPVAPALLWGNVASGLAGAVRAVATGTPAVLPVSRCHAEGLFLLEYGPLRGSGDLALHSGGLSFVRRSCCLYYRLDGGGMCGDCALLHARGAASRGPVSRGPA